MSMKVSDYLDNVKLEINAVVAQLSKLVILQLVIVNQAGSLGYVEI